jgi:hypothetical protein
VSTAQTPKTISSRLVIELRDLNREQRAAHTEIFQLLKGYPLIDGIIAPTPKQLDAFEPLKRYLAKALCPYPEDASGLKLRSLVNIIQNTPGFEHVSDAVVAAVVVKFGFQDDATWHFTLTNKLELWVVRACFWVVHVSRSPFFLPEDDFHKNIILAARELDLGPVCLAGHKLLVPVVRDYALFIRASTSLIQKEAIDCMVDTFRLRSHFELLYQTMYVDMLDSMSVPMESVPLNLVAWVAPLVAEGEKEAAVDEVVPFPLHRDLLVVAKQYCWMFVAANHLVFPDFAPTGTRPSWETVMINWDVGEQDSCV